VWLDSCFRPTNASSGRKRGQVFHYHIIDLEIFMMAFVTDRGFRRHLGTRKSLSFVSPVSDFGDEKIESRNDLVSLCRKFCYGNAKQFLWDAGELRRHHHGHVGRFARTVMKDARRGLNR
jgi:hypothetical protein